MGNKTKVSVIGLEGADMAMRVSNNDHGRYCHHNFVLFFEFVKPITARQRSLEKLMFSKVSVCPRGRYGISGPMFLLGGRVYGDSSTPLDTLPPILYMHISQIIEQHDFVDVVPMLLF